MSADGWHEIELAEIADEQTIELEFEVDRLRKALEAIECATKPGTVEGYLGSAVQTGHREAYDLARAALTPKKDPK